MSKFFSFCICITLVSVFIFYRVVGTRVNQKSGSALNVFKSESTPNIRQCLNSFVKQLKWQRFLLLADAITEADGRNVVSYSLKRHIESRLIRMDIQHRGSSLILADSDLQEYGNAIVLGSASTLETVLLFISEKNLISQYFHWLIVIPREYSAWETLLNTTNISKPENVAVLSANEHILFQKSSKSPITWTRVGSWSRQQHKFILKAPILQKSIKGSILNMAVINDPPYCIINETGSSLTVSGMDIDAVNIVADILNFSYRVFKNPEHYGTLVNGTWNGLAGALHRKEADFVLPTWRQLSQRWHMSDITSSVSSATCTFLFRRPFNKTRYKTYLLPFTGYVWFFFFVTGIVFVPVLWFSVTVCTAPSDEDSTAYHSRWLIVDIFFMVLYILGQKGSEEVPSRSSSRIVLLSFLVLVMLLMWCYCSVLVALLTVDNSSLPFNSLAGLVKNNEYKVGHIKGILFEEFTDVDVAKNNPHDTFVQLSRKVHQYKENIVDTNFDGIQKAYAEKYAYFSWMEGLTYNMGQNCSFLMTTFGRNFFRHNYGIPFAKGAPYVEDVSRVLMRMKETGILDYLHKKYFPRIDSYCKTGVDINHLGLLHFFPIFALLAIGLSLSVIGLGIELICFRILIFVRN